MKHVPPIPAGVTALKLRFVIALALLSTLNPQLSTVFAQGNLTPTDAPAPTFKTLQQIEPRTPISTLPFTITNAGSYYLTTNLTGGSGITITASDVTLDLMGFALVGGTGHGLTISGSRTNLALRNGTVRNWSGDGVGATNANNAQYQDLRLSANGLKGLNCGPNSTVVNCTAQGNSGDGISTGDSSTVSGCAAKANTGNGISAGDGSTVSGCSAVTNSLHGINVGNGSTVHGCTAEINKQRGFSVGFGSTVKDCTALSNGSDGIFTAFDCTVSSCTARRNDGSGISANTGNTVSECTAGFNGVHGITVVSDCQVRHNNCRQNGRLYSLPGFPNAGAGIYTAGSSTRIDDNNVTGNGRGINVDGPGNLIIRNSARGNAYNFYFIVSGNDIGPYGAADTITSPWANISY